MNYECYHFQFGAGYQFLPSRNEDGTVGTVDEGQALIEAAITSGAIRGDFGFCWVQPALGAPEIECAVYTRKPKAVEEREQ